MKTHVHYGFLLLGLAWIIASSLTAYFTDNPGMYFWGSIGVPITVCSFLPQDGVVYEDDEK